MLNAAGGKTQITTDLLKVKWYIPNQPEDTRFELLWKSHFSHL
jgi:hypothetical protein